MKDSTQKKLQALADSAKYDVSCSSSGVQRRNKGKGIGSSSASGICHSFTEDGRCISLLKIMLTNNCKFDCAYCISRRTNDIPRATFTVKELVDLTINFYRRNYIEGLFLSSAVLRNADYTMERMVSVIKTLREKEQFNGYIHMKTIPGVSNHLVAEAGLYADRLSVNVEIPTEKNLQFLAPEKNFKEIFDPMKQIGTSILENREDRKKFKKIPKFTPAGQSTQMIIGATPDSDNRILKLASRLYGLQKMKRVYYSGYLAINQDERLPARIEDPPLKREHRLYQADWLMRFYHYSVDEIVSDQNPNLDLEIDPKLAYALRHPELFPIDINKAAYELLLRIPGLGVKSAKKIVMARRYGKLNYNSLKKIGVVMKRAKYFISCNELPTKTVRELTPAIVRQQIIASDKQKDALQLSLFTNLAQTS